MTPQVLERRYGHARAPGALPPDTPVVLLFHKAAEASRVASLHAPSCGMLNTAKRGGGVVNRDPREGHMTLAEMQETVDDLNERGFPVKFCKCLRQARR